MVESCYDQLHSNSTQLHRNIFRNKWLVAMINYTPIPRNSITQYLSQYLYATISQPSNATYFICFHVNQYIGECKVGWYSLDISFNKIGDEGCKNLEKVLKHHIGLNSTARINLRSNNITAEGCKYIAVPCYDYIFYSISKYDI